MDKFSMKKSYRLSFVYLLVATVSVATIFYKETGSKDVIYISGVLFLVSFICGYLHRKYMQNLLEKFTSDICFSMDTIINDSSKNIKIEYNEKLFQKVQFKVARLSEILDNDRKALERGNKLMQVSISDTSHQIKTPLANLSMISETLLSNTLNAEETASFLKSSDSQLKKLQFIMEALIKSSRLETGMVILKQYPYKLQDIMAEVITLAFPLLTKKEQEVTFEYEEHLTIYVDKKWIIEAIFNILENAIKYSEEKSTIHIEATKMEMHTVISIKDTGFGIKESEQGIIFNRFYRGENGVDIDGVGIGLYLAREIVSIHNGYISVKSALNVGSTFKIHLLNETIQKNYFLQHFGEV